jgi:hypothetical protein
MLTISRLGHRSIKYYIDTANQAKCSATKHQSAGGGLAEYYSEGETRIPSWLVVGDKEFVAAPNGLGGAALDGGDTDHARVWLDHGRTPNGVAGREFTDKSVHGFDLTFSAPKSVSLIRALTDDIAEKVLATGFGGGCAVCWWSGAPRSMPRRQAFALSAASCLSITRSEALTLTSA